MAWAYLLIAGLMETAWAVGLKFTEGFTRPWPSLWTAAGMAVSFYFLSLSLKTIPIGTAYAVWTVVLGIVLFEESRSLIRLICVAMIVSGIVGLRLLPPA